MIILEEESISIHLKTKRKNKNKYSGWWILLELPADNISNIENVNIYKNDNPLQVNLLSSDVESFISMFDLRDDKTYYQHNEMHLLTNDFLAIYFRKTDIYPKISQELLGLENLISIKYLASSPSDYFLGVKPYRQILHIHFQQMNTTEFLKIIKIIEELEYVKYVKPDILYDGTKK